jgi:hypothetical protein
MSKLVLDPVAASAIIIKSRWFQRSTNAPGQGLRKIFGERATKFAVARMVAEPVSTVNHQTRENCTNAEPTSD